MPEGGAWKVFWRIFHLKALGFSSEEIAQHRGSSVNSVDKVMSRLKQKFRALTGAKE